MNRNKRAVAIDGPAAAGKSTVAKLVAKTLGYVYVDTGAMYRALTYSVLDQSIELNDNEAIINHLHNITIDINENQDVFVNGQNVTSPIRSNEVTSSVSTIASIPEVREEMVKRQQLLADKHAVVMDGRDIGTHVIPNAEVKVFLVASVEKRAQRRHEENLQKGYPSDLQEIKEEIKKRDKMDTERKVSPLQKATDAIEIDTTSLHIEEVKDRILAIVKEK